MAEQLHRQNMKAYLRVSAEQQLIHEAVRPNQKAGLFEKTLDRLFQKMGVPPLWQKDAYQHAAQFVLNVPPTLRPEPQR